MIGSKSQMYSMQMKWQLGNCLQVWPTIKAVRESSYRGPIAIRGLRSGMKIMTHIEQKDLEKATIEYCLSRRCTTKEIIYSEMAAPSMGIRRLLNGQILEGKNGYYLRWSDKNVHMQEAMEQAKDSQMLSAKLIIRHFADAGDSEDLFEIIRAHKDAVVEFSVLQVPVGWARKRLVIWEVRNY